MGTIDINCDVGEGIGNEAALFPFISSCNIACGAHAGNDEMIAQTISLASKHQLKIGAHPGYEDIANFGRIEKQLTKNEVEALLSWQILKLKAAVQKQGRRLHHVKLHGAFYNQAAKDGVLAQWVVDTIYKLDPQLILYVPCNSIFDEVAKGRLKLWYEAFADRNYQDNYQLVARSEPEAVIENKEAILQHVLSMVQDHSLYTVSGKRLPIVLKTLCVHGDTPGAESIVPYLHQELNRRQIKVNKNV